MEGRAGARRPEGARQVGQKFKVIPVIKPYRGIGPPAPHPLSPPLEGAGATTARGGRPLKRRGCGNGRWYRPRVGVPRATAAAESYSGVRG